MKKATKIKKMENFGGNAVLYRLNEPIDYPRFVFRGQKQTTEYVIVSSVIAFDHGDYETFIFPSDENGEILSWTELEGSYRGGFDHEKALNNAGYSVDTEGETLS